MKTETKVSGESEALQQLGFSLECKFVPLSQSRNAHVFKEIEKYDNWQKFPDGLCLNYQVTVSLNGWKVVTTDYSMGVAHCHGYTPHHKKKDYEYYNKLIKQCETGFFHNDYLYKTGSAAPKPDLAAVIYSLKSDADFGIYDFEVFCAELGHDTDSRKAEKTHNACRDIAVKWLSINKDIRNQAEEILKDY